MPATRPPSLHGDLDVLELLLRRRAEPGPAGAHRDGHRLALVVGGGGMRGSYTSGMLRGLERAGLRAGFDEVYGASSGAFGAAAFLVGEGEAGAACYPEDLSSRTFIDLRRLATGKPVLSLPFLVDEVLVRRKPLPWHDLTGGPIPLRLVATDTADLTAHTITADTAPGWRRAVTASASIPLLAGPPVEIDGRRWVDGSIAEPLAVARALRGGATHVLALLCRGSDELHPEQLTLSWWARTLDRVVPGLGTLAQGSRRYRADLDLITDAAHPGRRSRHLLAIGPSRSAGVGGLCIDASALGEAVRIGDSSVGEALDHVLGSGA